MFSFMVNNLFNEQATPASRKVARDFLNEASKLTYEAFAQSNDSITATPQTVRAPELAAQLSLNLALLLALK